VALILSAGRVPFIYVTARERQHSPELPDAPWVEKPYRDEDVVSAILEVCPSS
jgi:hypothetical protein